MKAVVARAFGPPDTFSLEDVEPRAPKAGEVRIRVHAAGVSYVDVLVARGGYQLKPPLPFVPGSELAGVVESIGGGVDGLAPGDRVCASAFGGAFAELATVPAAAVLHVPEAMSDAEASVFRVSYSTAYHALVQRAAIRPGETLLVLGAGGAVGHACVQVGTALGARVIASASTGEKRALATAAGAEAVLDTRSAEWRNEVKALTSGRGVDVVADPVGGDLTERAFRSLGWNGRLLVIGFVGGPIPALPTNLTLLKGASLVGVDLRQFSERQPVVAEANSKALFALYREGRLKPAIAQRHPIEEYATALEAAFRGESAGRVVLEMRP